jgi:hypothetical protein
MLGGKKGETGQGGDPAGFDEEKERLFLRCLYHFADDVPNPE